MKNTPLPEVQQFPAAKQRRLDELLAKLSEGSVTPREQQRLKTLVEEAEKLMVANAKLLTSNSTNRIERIR